MSLTNEGYEKRRLAQFRHYAEFISFILTVISILYIHYSSRILSILLYLISISRYRWICKFALQQLLASKSRHPDRFPFLFHLTNVASSLTNKHCHSQENLHSNSPSSLGVCIKMLLRVGTVNANHEPRSIHYFISFHFISTYTPWICEGAITGEVFGGVP